METICYVCSKPRATPGPDGVPRCEPCAAAFSDAPVRPEEWVDESKQARVSMATLGPTLAWFPGVSSGEFSHHARPAHHQELITSADAAFYKLLGAEIDDIMRKVADDAEVRELDRLVKRLQATVK